MTRDAALEAVRVLASGLPIEGDVDTAVARLMERLAASEESELLRSALVELGARALILRRC